MTGHWNGVVEDQVFMGISYISEQMILTIDYYSRNQSWTTRYEKRLPNLNLRLLCTLSVVCPLVNFVSHMIMTVWMHVVLSVTLHTTLKLL